MKVLITCGPTWVAIDEVRVISNRSTGAMGHLIAQGFHASGAKVTVIEGPVTHSLGIKGIKVIKYRFFDELAKILKQECAKKYDIVVHAAAVSDFKPAQTFKNKVSSKGPLNLKLVPTVKLIDQIRKLSSESLLVGFKLEPGLTLKNIKSKTQKLFKEAGCDLVVANMQNKRYRGYILNRSGSILETASQKIQIARSLVRILK